MKNKLVEELKLKRNIVKLMSSNEANSSLEEFYCWFVEHELLSSQIVNLKENFSLRKSGEHEPPIISNLEEQVLFGLSIMSKCRTHSWRASIWDALSSSQIYAKNFNNYAESDFNRVKKLYLIPVWDYLITLNSRVYHVKQKISLTQKDRHLQDLVEGSYKAFEKGDSEHALRLIVDSFERIKTIHGKNKKRSVEKVLTELSIEEKVIKSLNKDMRALTKIANEFCIRHHEIDKIEINDPDMLEFLFHLYHNYVSLILKKHKMTV